MPLYYSQRLLETEALNRRVIWQSWASLVAQRVNNLPAVQETWGSTPGLGRSPGEGKGNPLQYPCLKNSMDRGAWQL